MTAWMLFDQSSNGEFKSLSIRVCMVLLFVGGRCIVVRRRLLCCYSGERGSEGEKGKRE
jgi:hypothetical protein